MRGGRRQEFTGRHAGRARVEQGHLNAHSRPPRGVPAPPPALKARANTRSLTTQLVRRKARLLPRARHASVCCRRRVLLPGPGRAGTGVRRGVEMCHHGAGQGQRMLLILSQVVGHACRTADGRERGAVDAGAAPAQRQRRQHRLPMPQGPHSSRKAAPAPAHRWWCSAARRRPAPRQSRPPRSPP